ncbi:MAG: hypothetical protein J5747_09040 [Spirochaetaceae bacterium]|nr:hypothetical protein [Spirochaetaceae bacterium]
MQMSDPMKLSNYVLDEKEYFIRDGEVFTYDDDWNTVKVDMLPSSLFLYGKCTDAAMFEVKITAVNKLDENSALITAEDGSGIDFCFIEKDFNTHKQEFVIGQKGVYQIQAELKSVTVPRDSRDGVSLEGDEARKFFGWVGDEVEENATATVGFSDMAVYKKRKDFSKTGNYNFYGIISKPTCLSVSEEIDEPDGNKLCGFTIPLMNQFNRLEPRFAGAYFPEGEYHKGWIDEGRAVKAVLCFVCLHGKTNALYEYGTNPIVSPEEKGYFDHADDEYEEDENGNRWLKEDDE